MVLQRWSYENEVPSNVCSVLYIVCAHVYKHIERKHFKITDKSGYKPFIFAKSLLNFQVNFRLKFCLGFCIYHIIQFLLNSGKEDCQKVEEK